MIRMLVHYACKCVAMQKKSDIIVTVTILINGVTKCIKLQIISKFWIVHIDVSFENKHFVNLRCKQIEVIFSLESFLLEIHKFFPNIES